VTGRWPSFVNRPEHVAANAIKTWNRLKDQVPGWPDIELASLPPRKVPWTFVIGSFPASFQADVEAWLERLRNPDLFDASGPASRTNLRSVSLVQPILDAIEPIAAHCDG
jgi:hypothetical protein